MIMREHRKKIEVPANARARKLRIRTFLFYFSLVVTFVSGILILSIVS